MKINNGELLRLTGLATRDGLGADRSGRDVLLTGASADPDTGMIVSLASSSKFDADNNLTDIKLKYWRQLPYGESRYQNLVTLKTAPARAKGHVDIQEIWVQSSCVYDAACDDPNDPETKKRIARVLEGLNRINTHLREKGAVEETAKILSECYFDDVVGETLTIRGLSRKGGYDFSLSPYFANAAGRGQGLAFADIDSKLLKTILGFRLNDLEPDKDFSDSREVYSTDPQSGVTYKSGVVFKEYANRRITMTMYVKPADTFDDSSAQAIPELLKLSFTPNREKGYTLSEARFLGQAIAPDDTATLLALIGVAQASNKEFSEWKYPTYMDSTAKFDLLDMIDPLHPPKSLEKHGGEFLSTSLHGTGSEKRIENFGDQIGIANVYFHRGTKADGTISSVAVAVDIPFASGGAHSNYDGAIPDYTAFWDDIKAIMLTHDHFDHCDGLAYYAKAGMMKEKDVYCTPQVKYFLDKKMDFLKVPRRLRPKIHTLEDETPICVRDEDGNARLWVQPSPNATRHSALCTPYIITGCYGDQHYNGSAVVYGDGSGLTPQAESFFKKGTRTLASQPGVTPEMVDRDITVVYHDVTAINYDGRATKPDKVEENLGKVLDIVAADKGVLLSAISTNDAEYTVGTNVAHNLGRDLTAVGRNAELRLACKNLFGMLPDTDLRDIRIDPFEEIKKKDSLIPKEILDTYFESLKAGVEVDESKIKVSDDAVQDILLEMKNPSTEKARQKAWDKAYQDAYEAAAQKKIQSAQEQALQAHKEKLEPKERDHVKDVRRYMLDSLFKYNAVVFENDVNGYLMWKAVMEQKDTASIRATRTSKMAKDFRVDPSRLMIFITGTQGNAEEKFSTLQKFSDFFSLLDADEKVRPTGYKINADEFVAVITQPAIPGNAEAQEKMIRELVNKRNITVVGAFLDGFKIYNPKTRFNSYMQAFKKLGWDVRPDAEGNLRVYGQAIHVHGHGFQQDLIEIAEAIPADFHECHHIPGPDAYDNFKQLMQKKGMKHSGINPDDFQVYAIDAHAPTDGEKYKKVAHLNPSYVLVKMLRKHGQYFGGWLQLIRATMLRRDGMHRADGLMTRTTESGVYYRKTAQADWGKASNQNKWNPLARVDRIGPSRLDRREANSAHRSRPIWSSTPKAPGRECA